MAESMLKIEQMPWFDNKHSMTMIIVTSAKHSQKQGGIQQEKGYEGDFSNIW